MEVCRGKRFFLGVGETRFLEAVNYMKNVGRAVGSKAYLKLKFVQCEYSVLFRPGNLIKILRFEGLFRIPRLVILNQNASLIELEPGT